MWDASFSRTVRIENTFSSVILLMPDGTVALRDDWSHKMGQTGPLNQQWEKNADQELFLDY